MSSGKNLACWVLDVGIHMSNHSNSSSNVTDFQECVDFMRDLYLNNLLYSPNDRCGLILAGDEETSDEVEHTPGFAHLNVGFEITDISSQELELFSYIQQPENSYRADILSALTFASDLVTKNHSINRRLRWNHQIVFFTNIDVELPSLSIQHYSSLVSKCLEMKQSIHIYAAGLMPYDHETYVEQEWFEQVIGWLEIVGFDADGNDVIQDSDEIDDATIQKINEMRQQGKVNVALPNNEGDDDDATSTQTLYFCTDDEFTVWHAVTGLSRIVLTYILYYNINTQQDITNNATARKAEYARREKELILRALASQTGGTVQTFVQGLTLLNSFSNKSKALVAKFNGFMHFGSGTPQISLNSYSLTYPENLPSLSALNVNPDKGGVPLQPGTFLQTIVGNNPTTNTPIVPTVSMQRSYYNSQGDIMTPDNMVLGLRYGKEDIIPITPEIKANYDIPTTRAIHVLRIVSQESIAPFFRCSSSDLCVGAKDCIASQHFITTLASICKQRQLCILIRYVKRANGTPEFGVLFPMLAPSQKKAGFFYFQLPLSNDIRLLTNHTIPSLYAMLQGRDVEEYFQWKQTYLQQYKSQILQFQQQQQQQQSAVKQEKGTAATDVKPGFYPNTVIPIIVDDNTIDDPSTSSAMPLYDDDDLEVDQESVQQQNRYMLKTRIPLTTSSSYVNNIVNTHSTVACGDVFYQQQPTLLTQSQQLFSSYMDNMMLDDNDYDPLTLYSPLLQRFKYAKKQRLLQPELDLALTIRHVESIFDNPTLAANHPDKLKQQKQQQQQQQQQNVKNENDTQDQEDMPMDDDGSQARLERTQELIRISQQLASTRSVRLEPVTFGTHGRKTFYANTTASGGESAALQAVAAAFGDTTTTIKQQQQDQIQQDNVPAVDHQDLFNNLEFDFNLGMDNIKEESNLMNDNDIIEQGMVGESSGFAIQSSIMPGVVLTHVGETYPLQDTIQLITQQQITLAIYGLARVILLFASRGRTLFHRVIQLLLELRKLCITHHVIGVYNYIIINIAVKAIILRIRLDLAKQVNFATQSQRLHPSFPPRVIDLSPEDYELLSLWDILSVQSEQFALLSLTSTAVTTPGTTAQLNERDNYDCLEKLLQLDRAGVNNTLFYHPSDVSDAATEYFQSHFTTLQNLAEIKNKDTVQDKYQQFASFVNIAANETSLPFVYTAPSPLPEVERDLSKESIDPSLVPTEVVQTQDDTSAVTETVPGTTIVEPQGEDQALLDPYNAFEEDFFGGDANQFDDFDF